MVKAKLMALHVIDALLNFEEDLRLKVGPMVKECCGSQVRSTSLLLSKTCTTHRARAISSMLESWDAYRTWIR